MNTAHAAFELGPDRRALAETLLGHRFAQPDLLTEALTHRSAASGRLRRRAGRPRRVSNERLEFIGDRVLGLVMAEWLAERFPNEQEGQLGPRLAHLVSREAVAMVAEKARLAEALNLGSNEALTGVGRLSTVLADALEATLGALFLDGGLDPARAFIKKAWADAMQAQVLPPKDAKTALQEFFAAKGEPVPTYQLVSSDGPSHAPHFVVTVSGRGYVGTGRAGTKRLAERQAAQELLGKLK